ncbi:MAG TPA: hypothetical protein VK752_20815 [Bryobacteraceae bacterium]|jgi:hypothetical protein|nr:hypothetical protein [Bryobacteraceae bacterium]
MRLVHDNGFMAVNQDVTRRSLARMLAVAAAAPQAATPQTAADADLESARELLRTNLQQIAKVKLPMATEPACHFKA